MRAKGATDIRGMHELPYRPGARSKAQIAAELAHMEYEKAELERQLELWRSNTHKTEAKLQFAEQRIAALTRTLRETAGVETLQRERPVGHSEAAASWREVTLEY